MRELVKVVCQAIVAERAGDRIVGETQSQPVAVYSVEQFAELWNLAEQDVATANAAELAASPNRATRRRKPKTS